MFSVFIKIDAGIVIKQYIVKSAGG